MHSFLEFKSVPALGNKLTFSLMTNGLVPVTFTGITINLRWKESLTNITIADPFCRQQILVFSPMVACIVLSLATNQRPSKSRLVGRTTHLYELRNTMTSVETQ